MKKSVLIVVMFLFAAVQLFAHAPSSIDATFDKGSQTVNIKVIHSVAKSRVSNPEKHYVSKVIIRVNNKVVDTVTYKKQETVEAQELSVKLKKPVKKGDKISVRGVCNLAGSLEKVITAD